MKTFIASVALLIAIIILLSFQMALISDLQKTISSFLDEIDGSIYNENWETANSKTNELNELWEKNRLWLYLTLNSEKVEEIELTLEHMKSALNSQEKNEYLKESASLRKFLEHLPKREGLHAESVL